MLMEENKQNQENFEIESNQIQDSLANNPQENEESMENIFEQYISDDIRRGKVVEGVIVDATDGGWLVDVGFKVEGFLPRNEWTQGILVEEKETPQKGDTVTVKVVSLKHGEEAQLVVSRWRCEFDRRWSEMEKYLENNDIVTVKGLRKVKGGIIADCFGLEGFIPISHVAEEGKGLNLSKLVGGTFDVKVIEKDRRKRRLVLSRRVILEEERAKLLEEFYGKVSEGDVLEGTVSTVTSFGAFVDLGPIEGLVHISELSWQKNAKPKDVVSKGDKVSVKVIGIDKEKNKISLSLKQLQPDPWESAKEKFSVGDVIKGTITNVMDFGAFVEVAPGVEGLIHISDLSWHKIKHPKEVVKKGQTIEAQVLSLDWDNKRISLGLKQLHDPWKNIEERYQINQDYPVKVVRLTDFGAFVELEEGVEGLIHVSQISRKRVEKPSDVLSEGQELQARIVDIKPQDRRIRLSIAAIEEENYRKQKEEERKQKKAEQTKNKQQFVAEEDNVSVTIGDILGDVLK
ncbi:S1 RNA-binding domain-containing protein [Thermovirga sp.]|uniref:30S ribosomal protein S1 n=1 Tax=Thermovirga sp. TaxID=2699834 RepID=UPI0025E221C9|nr:S1 RNA-binding domain-containing protein [Thermovirga sp.]MBO8153544.1 S1 RNA-binding domain-containing protein [Thermovirga sp.]MCD6183705.1 S1 RNA-binding domain-containing protein [Thermovirga sp.]